MPVLREIPVCNACVAFPRFEAFLLFSLSFVCLHYLLLFCFYVPLAFHGRFHMQSAGLGFEFNVYNINGRFIWIDLHLRTRGLRQAALKNLAFARG